MDDRSYSPAKWARQGTRRRTCRNGRGPAPLLQPAEPTLDRVLLGILGRVEPGRPATGGSLGLAALLLIRPLRDRVLHTPAAQLGSGRGMGVRLVGQRAEPAGQTWRQMVQQRHPSPGSHRPETVIDQGVDLGGSPTPGPAQPVVGRFSRQRGISVVRWPLVWAGLWAQPTGHQPHSDGPGRWSSRPKPTTRPPRQRRARHRRALSLQQRTAHASRRRIIGDAVSKGSARAELSWHIAPWRTDPASEGRTGSITCHNSSLNTPDPVLLINTNTPDAKYFRRHALGDQQHAAAATAGDQQPPGAPGEPHHPHAWPVEWPVQGPRASHDPPRRSRGGWTRRQRVRTRR